MRKVIVIALAVIVYILATAAIVKELYRDLRYLTNNRPELAAEALIYKLNKAAARARYHQLPNFVHNRSRISRSRSLASLFPKDDSGAVFAKVFTAYSSLHAACSSSSSKFPAASNSSSCKFLVVEFGQLYGLGNKLLWLISAFLYSILTQRVLLLDSRFTLDKMLSEPFADSSWKLPPHFPYTDSANASSWTNSQTFFDHSSGSANFTYQAVKMNDGWDLDPRCFCDEGQDLLGDVPWLAFGAGGCLYIVPGFFLVPKFRKTLEALFPHRNPATHLLRHLLVPKDNIWSEITRIRSSYFAAARTSFGVQVRNFKISNVTAGEKLEAISRMTSSAIRRGFIPNNMHGGNVTIFIASLSTDLRDHLQRLYPSNSSNVHVVQLSSNRFQRFNELEEDIQALVEIIGLSFSQSLATTPASTFGYVAQSLGDLRPWLMIDDHSNNNLSDWYRGQSSEPCYQTVIPSLHCRSDDANILHYLRKCQDYVNGYQLIRL